jgi:hypothetical protein
MNRMAGWVWFQSQPRGQPSQIIIHVRLLDEANVDQQEALGVIGLNLLHGAFLLSAAGKTDFITSGKSPIGTNRSGHDQIFRASLSKR